MAWLAPKWFSAITCTIWLRFEFWRRGSAWFLGAHLFGFRSRAPIFGPRNQHLEIGPGLAWGGFGTKNGGWKNMVLRGNGFEIGDDGVSRDQNGSYGTQEAFGKASFPPTPFRKWFPSTFPYFGKFGEGPPGSPVDLLSSLCGSYRGWWHGRRPVILFANRLFVLQTPLLLTPESLNTPPC